jgi:homoserine kinase type II
MGTFTELSLADAKVLGAQFDVEVTNVTALSAGSVNSNFNVCAANGASYFARIYEEQGTDGATAELRLLSELSKVGVPTTKPLHPKNDRGIVTFGGKPFALYPWIVGDILCQARVTPDHCAAIGAALASLHLSTPHVSKLAGGRFKVSDLRARLDRIEAESPEHRDAALHIRHRLAHYAARRDGAIPHGVIHGDLFRDNVLWANGEIRALIDFESASDGPFAFDLMVTMFAWCYGDSFAPELVSAMFRGYTSRRPLEAAERAALPVEGGLAALRFATTRITDFSMRTPPGTPPARDYRRFLARLEALEHGLLDAL